MRTFFLTPLVFVAVLRANLHCLFGTFRHIYSGGKLPIPRLFAGSEGYHTKFVSVMTGDFAKGDQQLVRTYFGDSQHVRDSFTNIITFKQILKEHWQPTAA